MEKSPRAANVPPTRGHTPVTVRNVSGIGTVAYAASRVLQLLP